MTRTEFLAGMTYLSAGVGKPTPPEQMEVYWDLLHQLPFDLFQAACQRALLGLSDNFLPPAGAIHRHACDLWQSWQDERDRQQRLRYDAPLNPEVKRLLSGIGRLPQGGPS